MTWLEKANVISNHPRQLITPCGKSQNNVLLFNKLSIQNVCRSMIWWFFLSFKVTTWDNNSSQTSLAMLCEWCVSHFPGLSAALALLSSPQLQANCSHQSLLVGVFISFSISSVLSLWPSAWSYSEWCSFQSSITTCYALSNACSSPHIFSLERAEVIYFSHFFRSRPYTQFPRVKNILNLHFAESLE